jgi:hypothetical protein
MHYFYREWPQSRGDQYDDWGGSKWWLELDEEGYVTRCLQCYESGVELYYSNRHFEDQYGGLPEAALSLAELEPFRIERSAFEDAVKQSAPVNYDLVG